MMCLLFFLRLQMSKSGGFWVSLLPWSVVTPSLYLRDPMVCPCPHVSSWALWSVVTHPHVSPGTAIHRDTACPADPAHPRGEAAPGVPQRLRKSDQRHEWLLPARAVLQHKGEDQQDPGVHRALYSARRVSCLRSRFG